MILKVSDWMRALREYLHIEPIETNVIAIKDALENLDGDIGNLNGDIGNLNGDIAASMALLVNGQKSIGEISNETNNSVRQLIAAIESERLQREKAEHEIMAAISAAMNEIKEMSDIVGQHLRPTHHDHHK
jgi:hypothetical protein